MSVLTSWLASPAPDAAVQISPDAISVAVLGTRGGEPVVQGYAVEPLPDGALTLSLTAHNIASRPVVVDALRRALDQVGIRPRRVALLVPDTVARVSLVHFDSVPGRREDLEQLIAWQMKKAAPFPLEEGVLTYSPGSQAAGGDFLVVLARRDVVREYETVCEELGMQTGLVDLATLGMLNLFLASGQVPAGDWMVVHVQAGYTTVAVLRAADVIYFRNKLEGDGESLADVVHQTTMYYQDRLGGQAFTRVLLGGTGAVPGSINVARQELQERLGLAVDTIDPVRVAALTDRISAAPELMATLAPLVGVLLRSQAEGARA